jgi:hypothetical protein
MRTITPTAGFSNTEGEANISIETCSQNFYFIEKKTTFHAYRFRRGSLGMRPRAL